MDAGSNMVLCAVLQPSPARSGEPVQKVTLDPDGRGAVADFRLSNDQQRCVGAYVELRCE